MMTCFWLLGFDAALLVFDTFITLETYPWTLKPRFTLRPRAIMAGMYEYGLREAKLQARDRHGYER